MNGYYVQVGAVGYIQDQDHRQKATLQRAAGQLEFNTGLATWLAESAETRNRYLSGADFF